MCWSSIQPAVVALAIQRNCSHAFFDSVVSVHTVTVDLLEKLSQLLQKSRSGAEAVAAYHVDGHFKVC